MSAPSSCPYGLVLDIQAVQNVESSERGIARAVQEQTRALMAFPNLVRGIFLNPRRPFPGHLPSDLLASPLLAWNSAGAFSRALADGPIAYYMMSPLEEAPGPAFVPSHALRPDVPLIASLYDLVPLKRPEDDLAQPELARRHRRRLEVMQQADLLLSVSEDSRLDAIRHLALDLERIVVIGGGVSPYFQPPRPGEDPRLVIQRALPSVHRPFILTVSASDSRTNTDELLAAYAELPSELRSTYQLVIVCKLSGGFRERWEACARALHLGEHEVVFTDDVPDDVLRALYQATELFVFPPRYEGFGLPVVEAIACGAPAITSNTGATPEILDWAPATFNPSDPLAIGAAIERGLTDSQFRGELRSVARARAPLHSWPRVAERTVAALSKLPAPPSPRARGRLGQRRIALVGPVPPGLSGLANYNARLAVELARRFQVDLFSATGASHALSREIQTVRRFPTQALGTMFEPASYDAIIYAVDNTEQHHETYEVARQHPGIVWFHDVRLGNWYRSYLASRNSDEARARQQLELKAREQYGSRLPSDSMDGALEADHDIRYGLGFTPEWVRSARAVLVNSPIAAHLLRLDQGPSAHLPPIRQLPLAVPPAVGPDGVERDEPPVIVSFGAVEPGKLPERLIDALREVRRDIPARLVFVGVIARPGYRHALRERAVGLGLGDVVDFTGYVPDSQYHRWLRRASCAVQLHRPAQGGTSFALADCLSVGLPVVTNLVGAVDQFLPDAVVAVDPDFSTEELAGRLVNLLRPGDVWQRHHRAALQHASRFTFAKLADVVMHVVETIGETAWSAEGGEVSTVRLHERTARL